MPKYIVHRPSPCHTSDDLVSFSAQCIIAPLPAVDCMHCDLLYNRAQARNCSRVGALDSPAGRRPQAIRNPASAMDTARYSVNELMMTSIEEKRKRAYSYQHPYRSAGYRLGNAVTISKRAAVRTTGAPVPLQFVPTRLLPAVAVGSAAAALRSVYRRARAGIASQSQRTGIQSRRRCRCALMCQS